MVWTDSAFGDEIIIYKCQRRDDTVMIVNTVMPANTAISLNTGLPASTAMPMFLTSCETEMHICKYG